MTHATATINCAACGARVAVSTLQAHLRSTDCANRAAAIAKTRKAMVNRAAELEAIEAAAIRRIPDGVSGIDPKASMRGRFNPMAWTCPVCRDEMPAGHRAAHVTVGCEPPSLGRTAAVMAAMAIEGRA